MRRAHLGHGRGTELADLQSDGFETALIREPGHGSQGGEIAVAIGDIDPKHQVCTTLALRHGAGKIRMMALGELPIEA